MAKVWRSVVVIVVKNKLVTVVLEVVFFVVVVVLVEVSGGCEAIYCLLQIKYLY